MYICVSYCIAMIKVYMLVDMCTHSHAQAWRQREGVEGREIEKHVNNISLRALL